MLDEITQSEIMIRDGLERIDYLLNEFYWCHNLINFDCWEKQYAIDYFYILLRELKSLTNISTLLETYPSPGNLKDDIEPVLGIINVLHYESETFNISDEKIAEMKTQLNRLLDAVYVEIGNRMCGE